jgi:hypothetical protein
MENIKITNYKITPEQLAEIEYRLQRAAWLLNSEEMPDWEDLNTACRQICDAREALKIIREKSEIAIARQIGAEETREMMRDDYEPRIRA